MQTALQINTTKDKQIFGVLDGEETNSKLVIFVHGFTGSKDESHYLQASKYFNNKNYNTFRFNLYGKEDTARKSSEVSLDDHIEDTNKVIEFFSKKYTSIYLVGHSLGAPVVCFANQTHIEKSALWDPSTGFESTESQGMKYIEEYNAYLCNRRLQSLFGKDLIEQWMNITIQDQLDSLKVKTKIIFAGNYNKYDQWKDYVSESPIDGNYEVIDGASHTFVETGATEKLLEATYKWFSL